MTKIVVNVLTDYRIGYLSTEVTLLAYCAHLGICCYTFRELRVDGGKKERTAYGRALGKAIAKFYRKFYM